MKRALLFLAVCAVAVSNIARGADATVVTAQILDYENGYVFFTTGDGFRVAPAVSITDIKTGAAEPAARAREYARVTFDTTGTVTKIELSQTPLPPEGDIAAVRRFAVALSSPAPNPELAPQTATSCEGRYPVHVIPGRYVALAVFVQVPVTTGLNDSVYMTTDQSGWNPQAYRLDRVDALHYRTQLKLLSGTVLHFLFDRGSTQSIEVGQNGIESQPHLLCVGDADAQAVPGRVYRWGDEQNGLSFPVPGSMPTPYNPAPFPNLPTPPPTPAP